MWLATGAVQNWRATASRSFVLAAGPGTSNTAAPIVHTTASVAGLVATCIREYVSGMRYMPIAAINASEQPISISVAATISTTALTVRAPRYSER